MVEREIETTVTVEKEREVTETYLDDETVSETVHYCDACGELCEDRGGRSKVAFYDEMSAPKPEADLAWRYELKQAIRDSFEQEFDAEPNAIWVREGTTVPDYNEQYTISNVTAYERARTIAQSEIDAFDIDGHLHVRNHIPDERHDFCAECKAALEDTAATLDTAGYETIDHDDEEAGVDMFFLIAVCIDLIADAVTDIVTSRPRLTAFTISVCWLLIFSALALEVHIVFLVLQWLALPLGVWIEGVAKGGW